MTILLQHNHRRSRSQECSKENPKIHHRQFKLSLFLTRFIRFRSLISLRTPQNSKGRVLDPNLRLRRGLKAVSMKLVLGVHNLSSDLKSFSPFPFIRVLTDVTSSRYYKFIVRTGRRLITGVPTMDTKGSCTCIQNLNMLSLVS